MSHQPTKFGGHRQCGSEDVMAFCHVILQDHLTKGRVGGSRSR